MTTGTTMGLTALDHDAVERFLREWERLFDRGDARTMAAYYTEDATLIATQTETLVGRAAIEEFFRVSSDGARAVGLRRTVHLDEAECDGELGYLRGTVLLRRPDAPATVRVRYVTLWKRQSDGAWRLAVDISSPEPVAPDSERSAA